MYGQEYLYRAIINVLRDDVGVGGLVDLTDHSIYTVNGYKIGRKSPTVKGRLPFVGVHILTTIPLLPSDVPQLQNSMVDFYCSANTELTAIRLADRIEYLLHAESYGANTGYLDFSDEYIDVRSTRFKLRRGTDHDEKTDVWEDLVRARVIWVQRPCSSFLV